MPQKQTARVALCGVTAALILVVMTLGALIPASSLSTPMLAGLCIVPVLWEMGPKAGWLLFLASGLLAALLSPDKEAALFYLLLFGWYAVLRPRIQHIRQKPLRVALKLVIYNLCTALIYALLLFVLVSPETVAEAQGWTLLTGLPLLLLGNVAFLLYDLLLARFTDLYVVKFRRKLFPKGL